MLCCTAVRGATAEPGDGAYRRMRVLAFLYIWGLICDYAFVRACVTRKIFPEIFHEMMRVLREVDT